VRDVDLLTDYADGYEEFDVRSWHLTDMDSAF
jgi:hypothetical protein